MKNSNKVIAHAVLAIATTVNAMGCATRPHAKDPIAKNARQSHFLLPTNAIEDSKLAMDRFPKTSSPIAKVSHQHTSDEAANAVVTVASAIQSTGSQSNEFETVANSSNTSVAMSLQDFDSLALANNPTICELAATTQKAAGFRTQVGLRANPIVGYQGAQLADQGTDQHTAFVQQEIVTGGKLDLNRRVLNEALRAQLLELEAQKLRVSTDIRIRFFEALASQRRIELIKDFQSVTAKGLELANLRKKASEGSQLEVLQAKVQKNEIDLALQQAELTYAATWRELAAFAGSPSLQMTRLQGELPVSPREQDWDGMTTSVLELSPEYDAAKVRVRQAQVSLQRHGVQAIPNLTVSLAGGADRGTNAGIINLQVGAPIPVFNKNQGNIAASQAEYRRAVLEAKRVEDSIKARMAVVSRDYDTSSVAVTKYAIEILPSAQESLDLAEQAYKGGETSFVQALIARRTYFDANLQYLAAQSQHAQAKSKVDGLVLTGGLDAVIDNSGDDGLRGLTFSQQ